MSAPRVSGNQIDKLGKRLAAPDYMPTGADLALLERYRGDHADALDEAGRRLREPPLELRPTSRLKTTGTIIEKLRRERGMRLSRMQDVAGLRVVINMTRKAQDLVAERIAALFPEGSRVVDRREDPRFGYRAVHVIANVHDHNVEIQVRTWLQDLWAQMMERLADSWGRAIRYGGLPEDPEGLAGIGQLTRAEVSQLLMNVAERIEGLEQWQVAVERQETTLAELEKVGQDLLDRVAEKTGDERLDLAHAAQELAESRDKLNAQMQEVRVLLNILAEVTPT